MVERPLKVQLPFILLAWPFMFAFITAQDRGPWVMALIVYALIGGVTAVSYWPIAYCTRLVEIVAHFFLVAIGAFATALICALVVSGSLEGLFTARSR